MSILITRKSLFRKSEAAGKLGVCASLEKKVEIPVPCAGAVRFEHQAQFHPLKFLGALAEGLTVYENSPVTEVEEQLIRTPCGSVRADSIIFASHYPFIISGDVFYPDAPGEILCAGSGGSANIEGMYIGSGPDALSFRQYGKYLLIGGRVHRTGENKEGGKYEELRNRARILYPGSRETACWSAQDCITADQIPFIGQYAPGRPHWFAASGFQKWGMTSSMVSAMIVSDIICGRENPYADIFSPERFSAEELPQMISLTIIAETIEEVMPHF